MQFQYQSIAYSLDKGRSWTKYQGNPVLKNPGIRDFRDPKVGWYEEGQKWIMVFAAYDRILFYSSPDLIQWAPSLPKTRSGKIMRRILRKIAENDYSNLGDTSTLAEPEVVDSLIEDRMNR